MTKIELQGNFRNNVLINILIFFAILLLSALPYIFGTGRASLEMHSNFIGVIIIGGIIVGALSFSELFKRHSRINYLNLPASATEKVLSKAFVYIILYPLVMFLSFLVFKGIFLGIQNVTGGRISITDSFEMEMKYLIPTILLCISVFFYGAVRFNTYGFVKTIVLVLLTVLFLAGFTFLCSYITFPELRMAIAGEHVMHMGPEPDLGNHWLIKFFKILFYLAPLIFVGLSIVCLKEKEG